MRVLAVMNGPVVGRSDGSERLVNRHTAGFLIELAELGAEVTVAAQLQDLGDAGNLSDFDIADCESLRLATVNWPVGHLRRGLAYLRAIPWVLRETRRADVLYLFLPSHLGVLFAAAARLLRRPYGVYLRGALHLETRRIKSALSRSRFVLATTALLADTARQLNGNAAAVTPMTELALRDVTDEPAIVERPPFRILFVGRIEKPKGIPELLDGLAQVRTRGVDFQLELAGSGPEIERFRSRAAELGLGDAVFHGMVREATALADLFRQADLLVLPTHHEGFPRVLYEAMTYAVPVVTTFVGGIPSLMHEGENCVRIPVDDADAIAEAVEKTLADPALRLTIAQGGLRTMREVLDPDRPSHAHQVMEQIAG